MYRAQGFSKFSERKYILLDYMHYYPLKNIVAHILHALLYIINDTKRLISKLNQIITLKVSFLDSSYNISNDSNSLDTGSFHIFSGRLLLQDHYLGRNRKELFLLIDHMHFQILAPIAIVPQHKCFETISLTFLGEPKGSELPCALTGYMYPPP